MAGFLKGVFGSRRSAVSRDIRKDAGAGAAPRILALRQMPAAVYAIGDAHGCNALYRKLEQDIVNDAESAGITGPKLIVVLGDFVDRGPDSAGLLRHLLDPPPRNFQRMVLRGNHEDMMLAFLQDPAPARQWLQFGGTETLVSYGMHPDPEHGFARPVRHLKQMLDATIPAAHRAFLTNLPYGLSVGDYFLCHAGIDPARSLEQQRPEDLLWGGGDKIDAATGPLPVVVHGHVITEDVLLTSKRINVDTGAYQSGKLSAVRLVAGMRPIVLSVTGIPV
ncbi:metallophosphoesterase family protein [Roseinatronobacter sp. NSM]|uniref:metallophosphoesterase family protein n=1 Tax=Roseinatronobacter sp. NSM TaxID=3457785 RepID=UPI004036ADE9